MNQSGKLFALVGVLLAPLGAFAQEVPPDAWKVSTELGFNAARGNSHLTLFSTSLDVSRLDTEVFELSWSLSALYGENADSVVARRYRTGLNFDWQPEARVSPFVFVDAERDKFRKLRVRTNAGGGAKYALWRAARTSGSISAAVLHDYEGFTVPLPGGATSRATARWSLRAKADGELENGLVLETVAFFKPVVDEFDDYDIDARTKVGLKVNERVGLMLSWAFRYDSTPPADVRRDDQVLQIGLTLDF